MGAALVTQLGLTAYKAALIGFEDHLGQGCQTYFHRGHISLAVAFKGPNVILGLYKWNYSLTRGKELSAATW